MAVFTSAVTAWTTAATAEGAIFTANNHHSIGGRAATNAAKVSEVMIGGGATTSTVIDLGLRRMTTNAATPTDRVPAKTNPYSGAPVFQGYITASTQPTGAALATIQHVLNFTFNAFGGVQRWVAIPGGEIWVITATANNSEMGLVALNGVGALSTHYVVEEI
jgi:hypothetical protein